MSTSLAAQLSKIAASSESSLNLKAQKAKHSKSLIFEPRVAASQSFDTIYALCHEGFQELCLLDGRFVEFQKDLFNESSQGQDRTQMTAAENAALDTRLEQFLGLVGGRLRLSPAVKAVEWLVRRFRIHESNTSYVLLTFLPYHTIPIFTTLLSILPNKVADEFKFLQPYIRSLTLPPRHPIVQSATNNVQFASIFNAYVLRVCKARQNYPALLAFWAGIMTEATGGMLDKSRSGIRAVQRQNEQEVILRLIPTLNEGLAMKKVPDLRVGCYMLLAVIASKGGLEDKILTSMMEAVVLGWTNDTIGPGLVCLCVLAQHRTAGQLTKRLTKELSKLPNITHLLSESSKQRRVDHLANGLCLALVDRLRRNGDISELPIIQDIIEHQLLTDPQCTCIVKALVLAAHQIDDSDGALRDARSHLASLLVHLTQIPGSAGFLVSKALNDTDVDLDELELKLQMSIRPAARSAAEEEDVEMGDTPVLVENIPTFESILSQLPKKTVNESSLLSHNVSHIYPDLCRAFLASASSQAHLDSFDELPLLNRANALETSLYLSFYIRTWSGPYPVIARATALQMVTRYLSSLEVGDEDFQALLPYAIAALGDTAPKVRRAAAELLLTVQKKYPSGAESKKKSKKLRRWACSDLYGSGLLSDNLTWLAPDVAIRMLNDMIVPALEECVLDRKHVESVFEKALNSAKSTEINKRQDVTKLPQIARSSILAFFAGHVTNTPLIAVKLRLLSCVNQVRSIAGTTRTKVLLPVLQQWAALTLTEAQSGCRSEHIDMTELNEHMLMTIAASDKEGLQYLASIVNGDVAQDRLDLTEAVFKRLGSMWASLKEDLQLSTAQTLLDSTHAPHNGTTQHRELVSEKSAGLLRTVKLPSIALLSFLEQLPTAAKLADKAPATKRRRTSHGEVARTPLQDTTQLSAAIQKVTFVLQLIDASEPEGHPELVKGLFSILAELQHFKTQVGSELAYLQGLALSSLLSIVKAYKNNPSMKLERSSVRADLLVDCVQKTTSPQVQNAALLLIAALAETAPELVLHSVMPIFTFMGTSVLRQNDDYSAHVISQTIREVIPPLVSSLRKEKTNPVIGAAELLLSFVAAYEHVPTHRRKGLFTSLVQTLGPEDFLYALLAMLVDKYGSTEAVKSFATELSGSFGVEVQMLSAVKYLELIGDVLKAKPTYSAVLLSVNDGLTAQDTALNEITLLPHLLSQKRLVTQAAKLLERDDMDAARIRDLYSTLLESILALADTVKEQKKLHSACGDVLESLLGLLTTSEFVKSVESLLDRPNESLRRKILRSLQVRIDQERASDAASRTAMLGFLPQLTAIIRESKEVSYKHTAVSCVDKISEKYGKKDLEAVAAAAETIAGQYCLGQPDLDLRRMALLCLASLVEILREGIVQVLPIAIPKTLEYMAASIDSSTRVQKLLSAGYAFISALVHHLPYMISGGYLDKLLELSNTAAEADLDDHTDQSRIECMLLATKQVDAKSMFNAMEKNWSRASATGPSALREYLQMLSTAIDKHQKSVVTKYSPVLSKIFQNAFDLRRQWAVADDERFDEYLMAELEAAVNQVALKMIYKFNDATFRPIFSNLVEWAATKLPKKDKTGRALRLQSIYGFMAVFFGDLKSIVTSYATYILENAVEVLQTVNVKDDVSKELWLRVLRTLTNCFEHDQDEFWQAPSHFDGMSTVLCAQFTYAPNLPLLQELVPAIVELAVAADSSEHKKELNSAILKHMRSETASVRLAAIKCQQQLVDRLGEEWLGSMPEMLPYISELQEDDDETVEKETNRWILKIEDVLGESLDNMLQ